MDFRQFGIDERLLAGAPYLSDQAPFHEKMLSQALLKGENVFAKIVMAKGREAVFLLPALQWLATDSHREAGRVLCILPDDGQARRAVEAALSLGSGIGLEACLVSIEPEGGSPVLEGNTQAPFVAGRLESILAASSCLNLKDFGFLLVDGGEQLAELSTELIHQFAGALLPSWERKTIFVCGRTTVKAKNLAWDLSDNPVEVHIEEEEAKAQSVSQETWRIDAESKTRFFLGLLARLRPGAACVFCNLKSGAEELALRLRYDGVEADYILGSLPLDRKKEILATIEAEVTTAGGAVLVLTDEGAMGLPTGHFPLVVNYDIPLDPELYVKRLEMLDRTRATARVVNLACDRYSVGLPAVEQYIDAKLDATPVDESLLLAEDKSADLIFEGPHPDRGASRSGPRVGRLVIASDRGGNGESRDASPRRELPPRREPTAARESSVPQVPQASRLPRSGDGRRPGHDEQRRRGSDTSDRGRFPDRSPDIRRRISEATGGSLDVDGRSGQERPQRSAAPADADRQNGGQRPRPVGREAQHGKGGRQSPGRESHDGARGQGRRNKAKGERSVAQGGQQRGRKPEAPPRNQPPVSANPYELSMEERMKRYREKYAGNEGQGSGGEKAKLGQEGRGNGRSASKGREGNQGSRPRPDQGRKPGHAGKSGGRMGRPADAVGKQVSPNVQGKQGGKPQPRGQIPAKPQGRAGGTTTGAEAKPAKGGFLSRLFGRKKDKEK